MRLRRTARRDRKWGKTAKSCNPRLHYPKSKHGSKPLLYMQREMFLLLCAFLPSSSGHTFFSEETPPPPRSRWNQSASLSFRSSVGKSLREDKRAVEGGRQWKRMAEKDDSALFLHGCFSFVLLFHSSLLSAFLISHSLSSPTPVHVWTERKKPLPSFCSFNPPPRLTSNKKKNPDRKLKWTLTVNLIQTF